MKSLLKNCALTALLLFGAQTVMAGKLTASVDSTHISRNETLTLTLKYDERAGDAPDTSELAQQFNIRRQSSSSGIRIINGDVSASTTWEYELSPKRTGKLLIPSFSINGDFSEAISVDVDEKSSSTTQTDQQIYTETDLDKQKVYTQQQAVIAWRLVSRMGAPQVRFSPPHIAGVITQDLGNRSYQRTGSNGLSEWVIEQRYALFPQHSGKITIPAQTFQAIVDEPQQHISGFFISAPTEITRDTEEKQLEVMPPLDALGKTWLPAASVEILQQITGLNAQSQATVGTAFTRTIRIRAKGLSAEQLPAPDMQSNNTKIYAEKPVFDNKAGSQGNIGTREDRAAIIATQAGKLVLPAIHIAWYDTNAGQWRDAELAESTIEVLPNAAMPTPPAPTATPAQPAASPNNISNTITTATHTPTNTHFWQIIVGALLLALLLLAVYIYHLQQKVRTGHPTAKTETTPPPVDPISDLQQAIASGDWRKLQPALAQWATTPERQAALAQPAVQTVLLALEKHLYGNGAAPTPEMMQTLSAAIAQSSRAVTKPTKEKTAQLGSLY